ncbi:hypothetical protein [Pedobacter cryotolerans]|uniref:hypothetical protein n=1 Tax=Pedobacter cryotolerans TaxID=2571270 RepID=UPI00145F3042|nr:hypothetical protein [Pedobacter cryotolerans]
MAQSDEIEKINKLLNADNSNLKNQLRSEIDARMNLEPLGMNLKKSAMMSLPA